MVCAGTGITPMYQALWRILGEPGDDRKVKPSFLREACILTTVLSLVVQNGNRCLTPCLMCIL